MTTLSLAQRPVVSASARILSRFPSVADAGFTLHQPDSLERVIVEDYIREKFRNIYDARVEHFLPYLLSLRCPDNLSAAVGVRAAESGPLFLEQYLEQPIEQEIGLYFRDEIAREKIVELGNLVSVRSGLSQLLFIFLTAFLERINREWVVFTATWEIEKLLGKLNFTLTRLAEAAEEKLEYDQEYWGSYYDNAPCVMFGHVPSALAVLQENAFANESLEFFAEDLDRIAECWLRRNA